MAPPDPLQERFVDWTPIRCLGAAEYAACRSAGDGERRVVLRALDGEEQGEARAMLAEIARQHRLLDHPLVPRVDAVDDEEAPGFVSFVCDAVVDIETLSIAAAELAYPVAHVGAVAFALRFYELLDYAHHVVDPATGGPVCMGAFTTANVLCAEDGRTFHFGWGHPVRGSDRARLLASLPQSFLAAESTFGRPPTPGSDLAAVTPFFHAFHRVGEMPPSVRAALLGDVEGIPPEFVVRVAALMENYLAPRTEDRSVPRFIDDLRAAATLIGLEPDLGVFTRDVAAVIAGWRARGSGPAPLLVARDAGWCQPPGAQPVSLQRRGGLRRIVLALATSRAQKQGAATTWEELFEAGWPSEKPHVEAAKNRVYVAIAQLRTLGLRDVLIRTDAGYLFDPTVPLAWSDDAPPTGTL